MAFDVHLMCSYPEILLEPFAQAGADRMTIHVELDGQVTSLIWKIRSLGKQVGLGINPATTLTAVEPHLERIDSLLVMTVNPGFGGQEFIRECLTKIEQAAAWREKHGLNYRIGVDGGVEFHTARSCADAGADTFISGTALFHQKNLKVGSHENAESDWRRAKIHLIRVWASGLEGKQVRQITKYRESI